jgi:hypothetical protein
MQHSLLYNGYRVSFTGVKRPGQVVDHLPPSNAEVKERVDLYYSPFLPLWAVIGWTVLYLYLTCGNFTWDARFYSSILPSCLCSLDCLVSHHRRPVPTYSLLAHFYGLQVNDIDKYSMNLYHLWHTISGTVIAQTVLFCSKWSLLFLSRVMPQGTTKNACLL